MKNPRNHVRALLKKLTAEREYIDRAIEALRPLLAEETRENGANGNGHVNGNGHANGGDGAALPLVRPSHEPFIKVLEKKGEPMTAVEIHKALGRKAPHSKVTTFTALQKLAEQRLITRDGAKGSFRYSLPTLQ